MDPTRSWQYQSGHNNEPYYQLVESSSKRYSSENRASKQASEKVSREITGRVPLSRSFWDNPDVGVGDGLVSASGDAWDDLLCCDKVGVPLECCESGRGFNNSSSSSLEESSVRGSTVIVWGFGFCCLSWSLLSLILQDQALLWGSLIKWCSSNGLI